MRALKIVGGVIAAGVVVALLGGLLLIWWVDPNDYRDDIERLVEEKTGRPLQIKGAIELKVFPRIALAINHATLGNPPGFDASQPFLAVKNAKLGAKLMPLLHQRLEVSKVSVDGLLVTLISRPGDVNNWKDLTESKDEPSEGGGSAQASIAGVEVTNATLTYIDEEKREPEITRLSNLELTVGALGGEQPVDTRATFDFDQGEPKPAAHLAVTTQLSMPKDTSRIELRDLAVTGTWSGKPLTVRSPSVVVDTDAETLAPTTLAIEYGKLLVRVSASGVKLFSQRVVSGDITVPQVSLREVMPSLGMEVPVTRDSAALGKLSYKSGYRLGENDLALSALYLVLDDTHVRGTAAIEDLDAMALRFDLDVDAINVDRYLEPETKSAPAQQAAAKEPTDLPIEALRELNAKGALRIGRARMADLEFTDIVLPLDAAAGLVRLGPTKAKLFGGGYSGNVTLDARPSLAKLTLHERVNDIDVGVLMKAAFETTRVSGRGNVGADMTANGNTDEAMLKSLAGKIDADVKDGALNGFDLWYELRRAWALVKRQTLPTRASGPQRTVFKTLKGSALLDKGVVRNDDLRVDLDYLKANGQGTLDLSSKAVNYRVVAQIYQVPAEGAGAEMADLKSVEIPVQITGTMDDMKIRPDLEGVIKARVRKEVDEKVQEKKDELKKKLQDRLKNLLGE